MQFIHCDICKKQIPNPISGRTIFYHREFALCEACKDDLDAAIKQTVRTKVPFDFSWYEKLRIDLLQEGAKKNKIAVKH